ncbi:MAG TPA: hypothetical protein VEL76_16075 [Gemmataceae bacterium]|nr:hypothetical protein [Gemmataceae bacterium]
MPNADIVQQMREACDQWDAGQIDCLALGRQLVGLAAALEGIGRQLVEQSREWELELAVASDAANFEERDQAVAQVNAVVGQIRTWIEGLAIH